MKAVKKSPFRLLDVIFVGWSLISYGQFGHSSRLFSVLMISFVTSAHTFFIRVQIDHAEKVEYDYWVTIAVSYVLSGAILYYLYLRDQKYAHALIEIYRADRRMAWYARIVAIAFYFSPGATAFIYLLKYGKQFQ